MYVPGKKRAKHLSSASLAVDKEVLLKKGETVTCKIEIPQKVSAPVLKGEKLGRIAYYLDGKLIDFYPVYAEKSVEKISFKWYTEKVFHDFFH